MTIRRLNIFAIMLASAIGASAQVSFSGDDAHAVYEVTPASSTGLSSVYVLYDSDAKTMRYTASDASATVRWYKFGATGGAYAEEITGITTQGPVTELSAIVPNSGYIIEEGTNRTYVWVVNYADYYLTLESIGFNYDDADCSTAYVVVSGSGDAIAYYTINGGRQVLDREITLEYNNLVWSSTDNAWVSEVQTEDYEELKSTISMPAPYCNTVFTLSGDRFLEYWGEDVSIASEEYQTEAVAVYATAVQEETESSNQKVTTDESDLGGSAPVTITFSAYCTDAVSSKEWQMSHDSEFEEIEESRTEDEITIVFEEAGTTYWRFVAANASGDCEAYSDVYQVSIGESSLQCPNAFSPGVTEGVNDEWKVSYSSIIKFKCWIFNSWGIQLCELTDPSQGWDGKYRGKVVKPGVYYYVIDAEGSDGKKYKLKGDINVVGLRQDATTSTGSETTE